MRIVDTKGKLCPEPLIETKRALKETDEGETIVVLTDNKVSFNNLSRYLSDNNTSFKVSEEDGVWRLTVTRNSSEIILSDTEAYCLPEIAHLEKGDFVVVISSDKMGDGDDELGSLLMINFVKALKDLNKLPQKIVFYNGGVRLAVKSSPVSDHLMDLERMGVEIQLCATCVNHYSIEKEVVVGILSNMYVIAEIMSSFKIVKP